MLGLRVTPFFAYRTSVLKHKDFTVGRNERSNPMFQRFPVMDPRRFGCDFAGMRMLDQEWQWTVVPRMGQLEATGTWFHELLGLVYYRLRGWV